MEKRGIDEVTDELRSQLKPLFEEGQVHSKPAEVENNSVRSFRLGLSYLVIAVFALTAGLYPLPTDPFNRLMFLCFAFILLIVGARKIDCSIKQKGSQQE